MTDVDLFGEPVAAPSVARAAAGEWLPGVQAAVIADGVRRQDARVGEHAAAMADVLTGARVNGRGRVSECWESAAAVERVERDGARHD